MIHKGISALIFFIALSSSAYSQCIQSGPMLGHISHRTADVWIQTNGACEVTIEYWEENGEFKGSSRQTTSKADHFTHTFAIDSLLPGRVYKYKLTGKEEVFKFKTQVDWDYKVNPPAFTVAAGSCVYVNDTPYDRPGTPYGQGTEIFRSIASSTPDVMLWLGDNTYLRPADVSSEFGFSYRYSHTRLDENIQSLLPLCANYAITDDHDYGPNNASGSYPYKNWALRVFNLYWPNPESGSHHPNDLTSYFNRNGIDFFLLDNRSWREEPGDSSAMLGKSQIDWLIENLKFSRTPFKMVAVGGQILNTVDRYENMARYSQERAYLLKRIEEERIKGVIFLTGDRHMTELSLVELGNDIKVYDLTISALTSKANTSSKDEPNDNRVEGTMVNVNNYALLHFSGTYRKRELEIEILDKEGKQLWSKTLKSY